MLVGCCAGLKLLGGIQAIKSVGWFDGKEEVAVYNGKVAVSLGSVV